MLALGIWVYWYLSFSSCNKSKALFNWEKSCAANGLLWWSVYNGEGSCFKRCLWTRYAVKPIMALKEVCLWNTWIVKVIFKLHFKSGFRLSLIPLKIQNVSTDKKIRVNTKPIGKHFFDSWGTFCSNYVLFLIWKGFSVFQTDFSRNDVTSQIIYYFAATVKYSETIQRLQTVNTYLMKLWFSYTGSLKEFPVQLH